MAESWQTVDVDKIQQQLFSKYKFQIVAFICLGIIYSRGAWNVFGVVYLAAESGHNCDFKTESIIKWASNELPYDNTGNDSTVGITPPAVEYVGAQREVSVRECDILISYANGTNITRPCNFGWVYNSEFKSTIVSEWNLVCVRAYLSELSTTLYMTGSMLGALLITPMADKFGRRLVLLLCLVLQAVIGACVSLSANFIVFTTLRVIVGFFNMGIALSAYVMMSEIFPAQYRTIPCCGFQIFWAFGIMVTAIFGFLVRDWHYLQLVFSLPNLLCAVAVWFLPESFPWLISQHKIKKAQDVAERIAKCNGIDIPIIPSITRPLTSREEICESSNKSDNITPDGGEKSLLSGPLSHQEAFLLLSEFSTSQEVKKMSPSNGTNCEQTQDSGRHCNHLNVYDKNVADVTKDTSEYFDNVFVLCHSSRICLYSVIIFYLHFVNSLSYFGISLSTPVLHGNQFLNLFLLGLVEVPAYILCLLVCNRFGRKIPLCVFLLLCGFMNIVAVVIKEYAMSDLHHLHIACVMVGKFAITGAYTTVYLYAAEIFPTSVRNRAFGMSSFFENLGSIAAPFILFSAKSFDELPLILFGVVSVIGGFLMIFMPETQNRPLPQYFKDVESWKLSGHQQT